MAARPKSRHSYLPSNLKHFRERSGATQQKLAEAAGLPRATLASMEQGAGNPGLDNVMAVAEALGVTLGQLVNPPTEKRSYLVRAADVRKITSDAGRFLARQMSPVTARGVLIQHVTLATGCNSLGRLHPKGSQEFFMVTDGTATLSVEGQEVTVEKDCLLHFPGDVEHVYCNRSPGRPVTAISVVVMAMK
ncbi:MAG: helix-turn-helix domain-containing protein [Planctomycetes bacterium]|nr:helix-turn-helix domain-containing protein [Planctomycetota bacterium]